MRFEELPEFKEWLREAQGCSRESTFVDVISYENQSRNTRIMFYRWVHEYYLKDDSIAVNEDAKGLIGSFMGAFTGGSQEVMNKT